MKSSRKEAVIDAEINEISTFLESFDEQLPLAQKVKILKKFMNRSGQFVRPAVQFRDPKNPQSNIDVLIQLKKKLNTKFESLKKMQDEEVQKPLRELELIEIRKLAKEISEFYARVSTLDDHGQRAALRSKLMQLPTKLPNAKMQPWMHTYMKSLRSDMKKELEEIEKRMAAPAGYPANAVRLQMQVFADHKRQEVMDLLDKLPTLPTEEKVRLLFLAIEGIRQHKADIRTAISNLEDEHFALELKSPRATLSPAEESERKALQHTINNLASLVGDLVSDLQEILDGVKMNDAMLLKHLRIAVIIDQGTHEQRKTIDYGANLERVLLNHDEEKVIRVLQQLNPAEQKILRKNVINDRRILDIFAKVPPNKKDERASMKAERTAVKKDAKRKEVSHYLEETRLFRPLEEKKALKRIEVTKAFKTKLKPHPQGDEAVTLSVPVRRKKT